MACGLLARPGLRVLREVAQAGLVLGRGALARLHAVGRLAAGGGARGRRRAPAVRAPPRTASTLTPAGARLLPRAIRVLDELDAAAREAAGEPAAAGAGAARRVRDRGRGARARERWRRCRASSKVTAARGHDAGADPGAARGHARPRDPRPDAAVPAAGRRVAAARADDAVRARPGRRRARRPPVRERPRGRGASSSRARSGSRAAPTRATRCSACGPGWPSAPTSATSCATGSPSSRSSPPGWPSRRSPRSPSTCCPTGVKVVAVRGEPQETRRLVLARLPGPLRRPPRPGGRRADRRRPRVSRARPHGTVVS